MHKMCVHEFDRFSGCLIITWYKRQVDLVNANAVNHSVTFVPFDYLSYTIPRKQVLTVLSLYLLGFSGLCKVFIQEEVRIYGL